MKRYPGAKTNSGIIQFLINNIPYHKRYFELFAGTARLFFEKQPAIDGNFLTDLNQDIVNYLTGNVPAGTFVLKCSALDLIDQNIFTRSDFIYLDPPYPAKARRNGKAYYKHELITETDHVQLLTAIQAKEANVMISTRQNDLYDNMLSTWRKEVFNTVDRKGAVQEIVYCNYPVPGVLHQYDYVGIDFTERQAIKRKVLRFAGKIQGLPVHQKHLLIQELIKNDRSAVEHFLSMLPAT